MRWVTAIGAVLLFVTFAWADVTVEITGVDPQDGEIASGETATIYWKIEVTEGESGRYRVEIGGDGSPGSGELASADDASGSFSGTLSKSTVISADDDLNEGDGDYSIFVIAVYKEGEDEAYEFASTTIRLDNPPEKPDGLSVRSGDKRLFLEWNKPDDKDLERLHICYDTKSHTGGGVSCEDYRGTGAKPGDSPVEVNYSENSYILKGLENGTKYYIRIMFEDEGGKLGALSEEKSGTPEEVYGLAELTGEEGGCFVATALFGEDHVFTETFRALRDKFLVKHELGRRFVKFYYRCGPKLADYISSRPLLRTASYASLALLALVVAPAVGTASASGCAVWGAAIFGLAVGSVIVVWRRRR